MNVSNKCHQQRKQNIILLIFSLSIAMMFLAICSKSSFLYPINDWGDANIYLTSGKMLMNGKVLYKDIYDHKGPLVYFLHGFAYLISKRSFLGVYVAEVISVGLFLFLAGKCAWMYLENYKIVFFAIPVLTTAITTSFAFYHGDSVEELSLVFLMYSLYSVLNALHEQRCLNKRECIINGICAACILWIKYTMAGFYIGLIPFVIGWYIWEKKEKELWNVILFFLLGFGIITVPVLLYFVATGSLQDLFQVYFYNNMFLYPMELHSNRIIVIIACFIGITKDNVYFPALIILGLVWILMKSTKEKLAVLISFCGLVAGVYWGGRLNRYYALILSVYAIFGLIALLSVVVKIVSPILKKQKWFVIGITALSIIFLAACYCLSPNVYLMHYDKEDLPQYKFSLEINRIPGAKLLNYGFLDGGFYLAAEVMPYTRFFSTINLPVQEMYDSQKADIENAVPDFIVTREPLEEDEINSNHYECIKQESFYFEDKDRIYYLYQRR